MKNEELLNYAIDNIDPKYIDETAEALYSRTGKERRLIEIKVTRSPAPKKKSHKWAVGIAASVAVVAGIGAIAAVLPKTEWGRPSAASQGIEITLPTTEKPLIETEPVPEDEISEMGLDYPIPPADIKGNWIGGNGGDYMYAVNYNDDGETDKIIAFNTVTGDTITKECDGYSSVAGVYKNGVIALKTTANRDKIASTTVYDEKLNFLFEATVPDENYSFIQPQWDGKYFWAFYDNNESLKRNDRSCAIYLYTPNDNSEPVFAKSVTLPQYICSVVDANYNENKDEIAFFGQKFAEGTDISEGFKSVFGIINAETGELTFEREYDEYCFCKATFDGGLIITRMRESKDEEYNALPVLIYNDGTELEITPITGSVSGVSVSPNGKYLAVQINDSNPGGDETIRIYEIENRKIVNSDSPAEIKYNSPEEGVGGFVGNNGLYYNNKNGMLNVLVPPEKEDRDFSAETAGIIEAIKKYTESEISETIDTIEEHKAYLAGLEEEKANAEDLRARLVNENEDTTENNPEKNGAYEKEIRILEENIAAIDVKIEEAKERIKKFEDIIAKLEERAKEALGVSTEEESESHQINKHIQTIIDDALQYVYYNEGEVERLKERITYLEGLKEQMRDKEDFEKYEEKINEKIEETEKDIVVYEYYIEQATEVVSNLKENPKVEYNTTTKIHSIEEVLFEAGRTIQYRESEIQRLEERRSYLYSLKEQMKNKEDYEKYETRINEELEEIRKQIIIHEHKIEEESAIVFELKSKLITEDN